MTAAPVTDARLGDVWLVDLGEPIGHEQGFRRPGLVVSADGWNAHAPTVTILPITRTRHGLPTRVEIEPGAANGLDAVSYARCEDVRSVSERRLIHRLGRVDEITLAQVHAVMRLLFEL